jgi:hypothetical protein
VYWKLIDARFPMKCKKSNYLSQHKLKLTSEEKDYWWQTLHDIIQTQNQKSKHVRNENNNPIANTCVMCKTHKETREHMEYTCETLNKWWKFMSKEVDNWHSPKNYWEWRLEKSKLTKAQATSVAIGRYLWHRERLRVEKRSRLYPDFVELLRKWKNRVQECA